MPNYDYKCEGCGHKFTVLVPIAEKDQVKCPQCNSSQTKQLFTGFAVGVKNRSDCNNTCGGG